MHVRDTQDDASLTLDKQPLSPPPNGVVPNFQHPSWHGQAAVIATAVCIPLMLLLASIRVYFKVHIVRKWALDDSIFLVSLGAALSYIALTISIYTLWGYNSWDRTLDDFTQPVLQRYLVLVVLSGPLSWMIKLGVFSFILVAFRSLPRIRILVYFGVVSTGLFHVAVAIITGVWCRPESGQDRDSYLVGFGRSECASAGGTNQILSITSAVVNLACDLYLLVLPMPAIVKLNLSKKKKLSVLLIFLTGILGCIMSTLALYTKLHNYVRRFSDVDPDGTRNSVMQAAAAIVESAVGIFIPCMASLVKVSKHAWSTTPFVSAGSTKFRPTLAPDGNTPQASHELNPYLKRGKNVDLDTIDRMMMHISPDTSKTYSTRNYSQLA